MALDNPFHHCQSDSSSGVFALAMQPLEQSEDPLVILGSNADTVVTNGKYDGISILLRRNMDQWRLFGVLQRVGDQVLNPLRERQFFQECHRDPSPVRMAVDL